MRDRNILSTWLSMYLFGAKIRRPLSPFSAWSGLIQVLNCCDGISSCKQLRHSCHKVTVTGPPFDCYVFFYDFEYLRLFFWFFKNSNPLVLTLSTNRTHEFSTKYYCFRKCDEISFSRFAYVYNGAETVRGQLPGSMFSHILSLNFRSIFVFGSWSATPIM